MAKLGRQMYLTSEGKKLNNYKVNLKKSIIEKAEMENTTDVKIEAKPGMIIITKM